MSKRDVLDERLARQYSWRALTGGGEAALPDAAPEVAPAPKPPPAEETSAIERERYERAAREGDEFARQILRAWEMTPRPRQIAATAALFERAQKLSLRLVGMDAHPRACVRFWRLLIRNYDRLPKSERRHGVYALGFLPVSPREPEVVDLLVEAAEAGVDETLAFVLERHAATEEVGQRNPALGARLAQVLDSGKTWRSRELAARWLSLAEFREAIPALRRALRRPHARIRWYALHVLLQMAEPALTADDVGWLLDDAVKHPLAESWGDRARTTIDGYEKALIEAVAKHRPEGGHRPLEIIASGEGVYIRRERGGLDSGWAIQALAAGWPERAAAWIDDALWGTRSWRRYDAVAAIGLLPEELARPRLLEAAALADAHYVAERAKDLWFERFKSACPIDPLAGVQVGLLAAPPGERMLARLAVLRGKSDEARGAMMTALLAEAPAAEQGELSADAREAMVLLLFVIRSSVVGHKGEGLPSSEREWAQLLITRFGAPAFEGLVALAARQVEAGVDHGWLGALASVAKEGGLDEAQRARLVDVARAALRSAKRGGASDALQVLGEVGVPEDLIDRVWSLAIEPRDEAGLGRSMSHHLAVMAGAALMDPEVAPAIDARLVAEAEAAWAAKDYRRLGVLLHLAGPRGVEGALDVAARCMEAADDEDTPLDVIWHCGLVLRGAGRIDDAWVLAWLEQPASRRFTIASQQVDEEPSLAVLGALTRALDSTAREGAAAAEAADVLLWRKAIGADDARLDGILERAPMQARASLAGSLVRLNAPLAPLRRHVMELLLSDDAKAAEEIFEDFFSVRPEGTWELFEDALKLGPNPRVRDGIEHFLGEPSEAELYWRDGGDDEEEDDDEDA